jgi:predicted lysophospholipase L1 biosynthesis ABC-type transport system permease subunit
VLAISAPVALAFETLVRTQILARAIGPDLEDVRRFLSPSLTRFSWALTFVTLFAGIVGVAAVPVAARRIEAAAKSAGRELDRATREKQIVGRLYLLTSIPQAPAILATFCFTFGSRLLPVLIAMALSTAAVVAQGVVAARMLQKP